MPQTDSLPSLKPTHIGRHLPKLEPPPLVSSDIRWWVHGQPLAPWSLCPRISPVSCMHQSTSLSTTRKRPGHVRYSCSGWLWTHQQIAHEVSADGSSCGACVRTCGSNGDGHPVRQISSTLILGLYSLRRRRLISIGIPIINLRRSSDRLRFIMGIPIPVRRRLLSE